MLETSKDKVNVLKTKVISMLQSLKQNGDIDSATWTLTYLEVPEQGSV